MAGIMVTKVVREHHDLKLTADGSTSIGAFIDEQIDAMLEAHNEVQAISVEIADHEWAMMMNQYHLEGRGLATTKRVK